MKQTRISLRQVQIFLISVSSAIALLIVERSVGIEWNYSLDCQTYINNSDIVFNGVLQNPVSIFNNGYFVVVALLNSSVFAVTALNIFLYAMTNSIIAGVHWRVFDPKRIVFAIPVLLLLLNPYRMHLATTVLKDTSIIFLLTLIVVYTRYRLFTIAMLLVIRLAGIFYCSILLTRRQTYFLVLVGVLTAGYFFAPLVTWLLTANTVSMNFRSYDSVPSFVEFGFAGIVLRALIWPFLAMTGAFFVVSPSAQFPPVALGVVGLQVYSFLMTRKLGWSLAVYLPMFVLAAIVSGFTTYIRYVFPLITILPLVGLLPRGLLGRHRRSNSPPLNGKYGNRRSRRIPDYAGVRC